MKIMNPYDNGSKSEPQRILFWLRELDNINVEMLRLSKKFVSTYRKGKKELSGKVLLREYQASTAMIANPQFINLWGNAIRDVYGCGAESIINKVAKRVERKP